MHKPANWIVDASQFNFTISPTMQAWVDAELFPQIIATGLKKMALIMSKDVIVDLSIEQLMEENVVANSELVVRYFREKQEAENWIMDLIVEP